MVLFHSLSRLYGILQDRWARQDPGVGLIVVLQEERTHGRKTVGTSV